MSITSDRVARQRTVQPVFGFVQRVPAPVIIGWNGGGIESTSSGTLTSRPTGIATGDIELVAIQTQTGEPGTISTAGWTQVANSPQDSGAGGCDLAVYWHRFTSGDAEPTINDSGDHQVAYNFAIRGAGLGGRDPIVATIGATEAASTSINFPSLKTPAWNCLVVAFAAILRDVNDTNGNFNPGAINSAGGVQLTKVFDRTSSVGSGGGFAYFAGIVAEPGPTGVLVCPHVNAGSLKKSNIVLALR